MPATRSSTRTSQPNTNAHPATETAPAPVRGTSRSRGSSSNSNKKGKGRGGSGSITKAMGQEVSSSGPGANREDFVFFWKTNERYGWASQWYYAPFRARIQFAVQGRKGQTTDRVVDSEREYTFPTAEHWMMGCKALLFSDKDVFQEVVRNKGRTQEDLRVVKSLGRRVRNFDEEVWNANRREIVLQGSLHKFRSHADLRRELIGGEGGEGTGEREIVEASPLDRIWGIGFGDRRALEVGRGRWGMNLLGLALMDTRRILREESLAANSSGIVPENGQSEESRGDVVMEDVPKL